MNRPLASNKVSQGRMMYDPSVNPQTVQNSTGQDKQSRGTRFKSFFRIKRTSTTEIYQKRKKTIIIFGLVLVLAGAGIGYGIYQYELSQNPAVIYARKLQTLTQVVSKHVALPTGEQPVTATVTDVSKLPHEAFFANAQNGDKILLYKKSKKAILYRSATDQVIAVSKLDFRDISPTPMPQQPAVAGASTSALPSVPSTLTTTPFPTPQGKILIRPQ